MFHLFLVIVCVANFIDRWVPPLQTIHLLSVASEMFSPLVKEFKDKFMEHFLYFQVFVSLKPKFSLLASAAVLTDAADTFCTDTSVSEHGKSNENYSKHLGLDWELDWSDLRHSTFTTKQEIS